MTVEEVVVVVVREGEEGVKEKERKDGSEWEGDREGQRAVVEVRGE